MRDAAPTPPPARHDAPATSHAAAASIAPSSPNLRGRVLAAIADAGPRGLTDAEASALTGLGGDTLRPRRRELVRAGRVCASGRRRATPSGRTAVCWVALEHAPEAAAASAGARGGDGTP